jgi:Ca2+-binding RTX toxin-like protein
LLKAILGGRRAIMRAVSAPSSAAAPGGTDLVQASVSHTLAANVENLTLTGGAAINGTGNSAANTIIGSSGTNTLKGLAGNDVYVVQNAGDVVDESATSGSDTEQSTVTFSLSDTAHAKGSIENLTLTGSAAINGTGNSAANTIIGNSAAERRNRER